MTTPSNENRTPYIVTGSGELVSHIFRACSHDTVKYSFNLFKLTSDGGATQQMQPGDLRDIVKTCQVISFLIQDDGWESAEVNQSLLELNLQLDSITSKWSVTDG